MPQNINYDNDIDLGDMKSREGLFINYTKTMEHLNNEYNLAPRKKVEVIHVGSEKGNYPYHGF